MTSSLRRSSNGSVTTNGGGRSSSQISIYDYPEHLNPFYEDDNHKRIRFWKASTSNKSNGGRDRSNSFSLNALKEMWAFKSFRLKKRSSTLGINKTSESPPQLRRHDPDTSMGPLFDGRIRHTVNGETDQFRRGVGYRSSLQNVHSNNGSTTTLDASGSSIGFNRNDRYRSTIQNGYQTTPPVLRGAYVNSRGSVTPTPARSTGMAPGVSHSSLNSTNPFDDDDDDENEANVTRQSADNEDNVSRVTVVNGGPDGEQGTTTIRKAYRKKRRAPPPPPPRTSSVAAGAAAIAAYQSEATTATNSTAITTVPETSRENSAENEEDISQLAAQIASFVRTADTAEAERLRLGTPEQDLEAATTTTATSSSSSAQAVHIAEVHRDDDGHAPIDPPSPLLTLRALPASARDSPENNAAYPDEAVVSRSPTPSGDYVDRHYTDTSLTLDCAEKQLNTLKRCETPRIVVREATTEDEVEDVKSNNTLEEQPLPEVPAAATTTTTTTTSTVVRVVEQPRRQTPIVHSLHIAESIDDLTTNDDDPIVAELKIIEETPKEIAEAVRPTSPVPAPTVPLDPQRYKMAFVAVKSSPPEPSTTKSKWTAPWSSSSGSSSSSKTSTSPSQPERLVPADRFNDKPLLRTMSPETTYDESTPAPPRRRRSVKDIIESINKCQSLLRINQTDAATTTAVDHRVTSLETIDQRNNANNNNGSPRTNATTSAIPSNGSIDRKASELLASEEEFRETVRLLERQNSSDRNNNNSTETDDVLHQLPIMVERYGEFSGEFKKCNASPKSPSTTETTDDVESPVLVRRREKTRTDWNPLPKPRRSRNLTQEAIDPNGK